jgi:hypothetical protein
MRAYSSSNAKVAKPIPIPIAIKAASMNTP